VRDFLNNSYDLSGVNNNDSIFRDLGGIAESHLSMEREYIFLDVSDSVVLSNQSISYIC
jgi:hypothetical protein